MTEDLSIEIFKAVIVFILIAIFLYWFINKDDDNEGMYMSTN